MGSIFPQISGWFLEIYERRNVEEGKNVLGNNDFSLQPQPGGGGGGGFLDQSHMIFNNNGG